MATESARITRIVVAVDSAGPGVPAIETAVGLATGLDAALEALFIEDEQLLRIAALPFARELAFPSAQVRPLAAADLERALRAQAAEVRRRLAAVAEQLPLSWTLTVERGEVLHVVARYTAATDVVVLGRPGRLTPGAGERWPRPGTEPARWPARRPVLVVCDGSETADRALAVAHRLAATSGGEIVALVPAPGPEAFRKAREAAVQMLARHGGEARYAMLPDSDPATLARAARLQHAGVLVHPLAGGQQDARRLAQLLAELPCPLVLTG